MEHERLYENKLLACPSSKYEYREHRSKNCLDKIVKMRIKRFLAITIPMLCFCICMLRFCYVARKQNKPEKVKCSEETSRVILSASARLPNSVNKAKSKSGTSQHFVTDRICPEVDDRLRNYLDRPGSGRLTKTKNDRLTSKQDNRL
uniref:Uncharacterized protein n=1 Tax=Wuchereria bancrofti TaxID=6293 RepID=A0A1I8EDN6_WUCBA